MANNEKKVLPLAQEDTTTITWYWKKQKIEQKQQEKTRQDKTEKKVITQLLMNTLSVKANKCKTLYTHNIRLIFKVFGIVLVGHVEMQKTKFQIPEWAWIRKKIQTLEWINIITSFRFSFIENRAHNGVMTLQCVPCAFVGYFECVCRSNGKVAWGHVTKQGKNI